MWSSSTSLAFRARARLPGGIPCHQRRWLREKATRERRRRRRTEVAPMDLKKAESMVVYKDDDILAINKPPGLAVHGGSGLSNHLTHYLPTWQYDKDSPPQLVHRLDRDTTGVLLLSRHTGAARRMAKLFQEQKMIKKYLAITISVPEQLRGSITVPIGHKNMATKNPRRHQMHRVVLRTDLVDEFSKSTAGCTLDNGVQLAWTDYTVLSTYGQRCSLISVHPVTGFKHQIRVHLADGLQCPVLGDYKFAGPLLRMSRKLKRKLQALQWVRGPMCLHSYELSIPDYIAKGKPLVIRAPVPDYFSIAAKRLGLKLPSRAQARR